jgi:hypothetical protein
MPPAVLALAFGAATVAVDARSVMLWNNNNKVKQMETKQGDVFFTFGLPFQGTICSGL